MTLPPELREKAIKVGGKKVIVDTDDYLFLKRFKWSLSANGYAWANAYVGGKYTHIFMHRLITRFGLKNVDHINRNKLDNRKANLRLVARWQNNMNRKYKSKTGYRGVTVSRGGKFQARIKNKRHQLNLGCFDTASAAAKAYDKAAKEKYGRFAQTNF